MEVRASKDEPLFLPLVAGRVAEDGEGTAFVVSFAAGRRTGKVSFDDWKGGKREGRRTFGESW